MNSEEARAALAGAGDARARLAARMEGCPPWRHAAFGLVLAIMVGSAAVSLTMQMAGLSVGLLLVVLLVNDDRRRYGVFVNGYRKGKTRPLTFVLLGAMLALLVGAIHARDAGLSPWTKVGLAAIAFALATWASVVWKRTYVRELREGAA